MKKPVNLLEWGFVNPKFPWGIFFLVGGGTAVGEACKVGDNQQKCYIDQMNTIKTCPG